MIDSYSEIQKKAEYWASSEQFDAETRDEVANLLKSDNQSEISDRFFRELAFGTGGMRGIMGAGTCRMNVYNIRKASYAVGSYLQKFYQDSKQGGLSIAISYDSRHNSQLFARSAAEVLTSLGIKVLITKDMRPVPMLSFMVRKYKCQAGICITASHNPPEYNGFKVYWGTGGQLVPPHDKEITKTYESLNGNEVLEALPYAQALSSGLVQEVGSELDQSYLQRVKSLSLNPQGREEFKIVYSPLHGTGIFAVPQALKGFGFEHIIVPAEQEQPDGHFPTVSSPNPEDSEALSLALELAKKEQADLVLATDPDSDRIGCIVKEGQEYINFNGNQIGSLLIDYILSSKKRLNQLPQNPLVIKTIVTTDLQRDIAAFYGAECEETLTGFKWICHLIEDYETGQIKPKKNFVCGGEESYGFLADTFVRDKDAIIACCLMSEMVAYYKSQGLTVSQKLDELFSRHKVYQESLFTVTLGGQQGAMKISETMESLRNQPPKEVCGVDVVKVVDLEQRKTFVQGDRGFKESDAVALPRSNVLQFFLSDGSKLSIRPSGTEPKIKVYISVNEDALGHTKESLQEIKRKVVNKVEHLQSEFEKLLAL